MLSKKIDELIEKKSLLKHPFYQSWNEGKLTLHALKGYSQEYFQLVKAVPELMKQIVKGADNEKIEEIDEIIKEEILHIKFWSEFADELGIDPTSLKHYQCLEKTKKAVDDLFSLTHTFQEGAVAMYALEKEIPIISETKISGLKEFYGISSTKALRYFNLHTEADIRHAKIWEDIINDFPSEKHSDLLEIANKSLDAQNILLDACFEAYCI
jgi:pyrroloquinoline-quinone synthase